MVAFHLSLDLETKQIFPGISSSILSNRNDPLQQATHCPPHLPQWPYALLETYRK
jgi:hypothetical protein